jgi:hypothetical protein
VNLHDAFNIGKAYKLCPAPDACPGVTMLDRIADIKNPNVVDPVIFGRFVTELKAQILHARIRMPGAKLKQRAGVVCTWYHHYLAGQFDKVPDLEIDQCLVWENSLVMPTISPKDPAVWKDSGLGADTLAEGMNPSGNQFLYNKLTRMVFDPKCPMPGHEGEGGDPAHPQKMEGKAESSKDPARPVFSSNLCDRFTKTLGEFGVKDVAQYHPSFMVGASMEKRSKKLAAATAYPTAPGIQPSFSSFDVKGWSARMALAVQEASHGIWGRLYGAEVYSKMSKVMLGATIYLNKSGYKGWYINTGSNLEGFDGWEMTFLNVAGLALTVRIFREEAVARGLITQAEANRISALLMSYIDDGAARIDLPEVFAGVTVLFELFKEITVSTFGGAGFTVEEKKCFPSDRFWIFLNEPYFAGRHITHGIRAAAAVCSVAPEIHETLTDCISKASAGCRGATCAGLDSTAAEILMLFHVGLLIKTWVGKTDPVLSAIWAFSPRAWGGLGVPHEAQLATTASGDAFAEGCHILRNWAQHNKTVEAYYVNMMRTPIAVRTEVSIMTAPLSLSVKAGYMSDTRVAKAVSDALLELAKAGRLSPLATEYVSYSNIEMYKDWCAALIPVREGVVIQEAVLGVLAGVHPHSVYRKFVSHIEKATTLRRIIGGKAIDAIVKDNRREARESYAVLKERVTRIVL